MTPSCEKGPLSRPSLLIADDHVIFLDALRALLEKTYCGDWYGHGRSRTCGRSHQAEA